MFDDSTIIKGCKKNRHKYQMALFDKYSPVLKGVCLRYAGNEFDADDLLQEGFIKILQNISNFKETGSFIGWMKRIMVNHSLNYCKKKNRQKTSEWNDNITDFADDEENTSKSIESRILDANLTPEEIIQIIQELPVGYRMVLNLYVIDGFKHAEIAEKLGISINTSKSQLSRARKFLIEKTEILISQNATQYEKH
jgi:RNA polymerase sigma-70 factor (ECF subfamily)